MSDLTDEILDAADARDIEDQLAEAISKAPPKGRSERKRTVPSPWPPRVWVALQGKKGTGKGGRIEIARYPAYSEDVLYSEEGTEPYISFAEHTHLLAEAEREAKKDFGLQLAKRFLNILNSYGYGGTGPYKELLKEIKASELRKGATPENGGKDG